MQAVSSLHQFVTIRSPEIGTVNGLEKNKGAATAHRASAIGDSVSTLPIHLARRMFPDTLVVLSRHCRATITYFVMLWCFFESLRPGGIVWQRNHDDSLRK